MVAPLTWRRVHLAAVAAPALMWCALADGAPLHTAAPFDAVGFLRTYARFSDDDIARLGRGEPAARTLEADSAEAAICAAIDVEVPPAFYIARFHDIALFKTGGPVLQVRRFGTPPSAGDLAALRVEDVDELRKCRVGDCAVKLDAAGIERARGITGGDAAGRIAAVYREHLASYAARYMAHGDGALLEYRDAAKPQAVANELQQIVEHSPYLLRELPRLATALTGFTGTLPPGLDGFLYWSAEEVGPRTVVSITHAIVSTPGDGPAAVATKQIYASHYFTASLGLTILADVSGGRAPRTRVIYINRSRVDAFAGVLGGVKRAIARSRARKGADHTLRALKTRLEAAFRQSPSG
jgi:hypothetical protein